MIFLVMERSTLSFVIASVMTSLITCNPLLDQGVKSSVEKNWINKTLDTYFLCDSSSSVWYDDFVRQLEWVAQQVKVMDVGGGARVGVGVFSDKFHPVIPIDNTMNKSQLIDAILDTPCPRGDGYISRGIEGVMEQGLNSSTARPTVPRALVIITDGESRLKQSTLDSATKARQKGIFMFTVGVGNRVDAYELESIASFPKKEYSFLVADYRTSLTNFKLSDHLVNVEYLQSDANATCKGVDTKVDTVFVWDEAGLGVKQSSKITEFIEWTVDQMDMGSGNVRVGVVSKQACQSGVIHLGDNVKRSNFKQALARYKLRPGLSELMGYALTRSIEGDLGARPDAQHNIVLFMDSSENGDKDKQDNLFVQSYLAKESSYGNVEIFVIYLGTDYDKAYVQSLASSPTDKHVLFLDTANELMTKGQNFFKHKYCDRR